MATSFNTKTPTPTTQTPSIDLSRFEISSNDSSVSKMTKLTAGSVALSLLGTVEVIKVIIGKILFSLHLKNANSTLDTAKEHFSLIGQNLRKIMRKEETLPLTRSEQKANWLFNKKLWISVGILSLTAFAAYQFAQSDTFARLLQGYSSKPPVPPIDPRTVALTKYSPIPGIDFPLPKPQPSVIECINSKKFPTNLLQSRKIFQCLNVSKDSCTLLYDCPAVKHDFRKLTLLTHPDVAKDMVTSVSQKLNKANEFLRNGFCDTHSKRWIEMASCVASKAIPNPKSSPKKLFDFATGVFRCTGKVLKCPDLKTLTNKFITAVSKTDENQTEKIRAAFSILNQLCLAKLIK